MRHLLLISGLSVLLSSTIGYVNSQPVFDPLNLSLLNGPPAEENPAAVSTRINSAFISLHAPIRLSNRTRIILNTLYDNRSFIFEDRKGDTGIVLHQTGFPDRFNVEALAFNPAFQHTFRDTTQNLVLSLAVRHYASDETEIGKRTLTPSAALLYTKRSSQRFAWKTGMYVSKEFFGIFFLPLLGLDWQAGNRLWVWGILPRHLAADYRLYPAWHLTFSYRGVTDSYRIEEKNWLAHFEGQLRFGNEFYIPRTPLVLILETGRSLARNIRYYDAVQDEQFRPDVTDSWYLRAGLNWRIITNKTFRTPQGG